MRVAHFCRFAPTRSGQYGTTRDIILAEQAMGIDAGLVVTTEQPPLFYVPGLIDKSTIVNRDWAWGRDADIHVRHTAIPPRYNILEKPTVMCLHGRPENSFMLGHLGKTNIYEIVANTAMNHREAAYVTFWKEYLFHWSMLIDKSILQYVPAPVDLGRYCPDGDRFDWGDKNGSPNIVIADLWREDTTPYNVMHAACYYKQHVNPKAAIHIFGYPPQHQRSTSFLGGTLQRLGLIGHICTPVESMEQVYRAADIVITPHRIATRIVRESLACGTPLVAGGPGHSPYFADPRSPEEYAAEIDRCWKGIQKDSPDVLRQSCREYAERHFDPAQTAKGLVDIFEGMIDGK